MGNDSTLYVGLDDKESMTIACAISAGEIESLVTAATIPAEIDRLCKRLQSKPSRVRVVLSMKLAPVVTTCTGA
jgi:transposase